MDAAAFVRFIYWKWACREFNLFPHLWGPPTTLWGIFVVETGLEGLVYQYLLKIFIENGAVVQVVEFQWTQVEISCLTLDSPMPDAPRRLNIYIRRFGRLTGLEYKQHRMMLVSSPENAVKHAEKLRGAEEAYRVLLLENMIGLLPLWMFFVQWK